MPNRLQRSMPTILGLLVTAVILVVGGFFLVQLYWPVKTFEFHNMITTQRIYTAGNTVTYQVTGCKFTTLPVEVDLQFEGIGSNHYEYPVIGFTADVRPGCGVGINQVQLPDRVTSGVYVLRDAITTDVNPFHSITVTGVSNPFVVTVSTSPGR